jgi:ribosomal protein L37AE/L43A
MGRAVTAADNLAFLPNVVRCETCERGVARMQVDGVWVCEACLEVLVPSPAPFQMTALAPETEVETGEAPSLFEIVDRLIRQVP